MIKDKIEKIEEIQKLMKEKHVEIRNNKIKKVYKKSDSLFKFYIINYVYKGNLINIDDKYELDTYLDNEKKSKFTINIILMIGLITSMSNYIHFLPNLSDLKIAQITVMIILLLLVNFGFNILPNQLNKYNIIREITEHTDFVDIFLEDIKNRKNSKILYEAYMSILTKSSEIYMESKINQERVINIIRKLISELEIDLNRLPKNVKEIEEFDLIKYEVIPKTFPEKTYLDGDNVKYIIDNSEILLRFINKELQQYEFYKLKIDIYQKENYRIEYSEFEDLTFNKTLTVNKDIWNNKIYTKLFYSKDFNKETLEKLDKKINKA